METDVLHPLLLVGRKVAACGHPGDRSVDALLGGHDRRAGCCGVLDHRDDVYQIPMPGGPEGAPEVGLGEVLRCDEQRFA